MSYLVFISHGWHDRWIARQMARLLADAAATPFIDVFDIRKGDRIEARVHEGLEQADELVALLTPWSVDRNWVWAEIAAAWALRKRYTGVLYGLTMNEIDRDRGGLAMLAPTNILAIDEFDDYIRELRERIEASTMKVFLSFSKSDRPFAERLGDDIRALGAEVLSEDSWAGRATNFDRALREALESADGVVLVVPEPGSPRANSAFFEAGAARALGKPVVAVLPSPDPKRAGEAPPGMFGHAVFDGSRIPPESLASSVVAALKAA